jgi:hypothetical protein
MLKKTADRLYCFYKVNQAKQAATFSIPTEVEWVLEVDGAEESLF